MVELQEQVIIWSEQLLVTLSSTLQRNGSGVTSTEGGYLLHILRPDFGRTRLWDGSRVKIADEGELARVKLAKD